MFLNKVDSQQAYIENTPQFIKDAFLFEGGIVPGVIRVIAKERHMPLMVVL